MNDIDSNKDKKESIFKVYKDKMTDLVKPKGDQKTNSDQANFAAKQSPQTSQQTPPPIQKTTQPQTHQQINQNQPTQKAQFAQTPPQQSVASPKKDAYPETPPVPPEIKTEKKPIIKKDTLTFVLKIAAIVIVALLLGYLIVNYQAIALRFNYWYNVNIQGNNWQEMNPIELKQATTTSQKLDENYLYIPTIGIQAPVNWGIAEDDVKNMLSSGLVNYLSSALPDDATGNIYILGNTSGPIWSSSEYKTVFTLLDKVQLDQIVTIIYDNNIYSFRIISIEDLSNSKIDIGVGAEDDLYLNLLARYPVGLNWKTLKIRAQLYKIESNILKSQQDKIDSLPDTINEVELQPIEVTPTSTAVPLPTNNNIPDPELLPDHFLPSI